MSWLHDIRLAGRGIRRSSGFFATAALLLSAAGVLVGLAVSFLAMRTLRGLLFEVQPFDAATLVSAAAVLVLAALLASYLPACARRAWIR